MVGVDISIEAIDHARGAVAAGDFAVELLIGEMRDIPGDATFDAAVCMGNSFGYLDLNGTRQFVAALAAAVRPGGGLVIDYSAAAESVLPGFIDQQPRNITAGDITATGSNTYDVVNSRLISNYVFNRGDHEVQATALHHVYTVAHLGECWQLRVSSTSSCTGDQKEPRSTSAPDAFFSQPAPGRPACRRTVGSTDGPLHGERRRPPRRRSTVTSRQRLRGPTRSASFLNVAGES